MAGDFNARLDTQLQPPPPSHTAAHSQQLLQLCRHTTLQLCTGRSPGDTHAPPTFRGRGPYPGTRLDHILISPSLSDRLASSSVDTTRQESDHYPIQARFQLMPLARGQPAARSHCGARLPRVQWQPNCQAAYAAAVQADTHQEFHSCVAAIAAGDLTAAFQHLHSGLQAAADESGLPRRSSHPRPTAQHHQPFYDAECKALKRQVRHLFQTQPGSQAARTAEKQYHGVVRRKKRAHQVQQLHHVLQEQRNNPRAFWKQLKSQHTALPAPLQEPAAWDPYLTRLASIPLPSDCHLPDSAFPQQPLSTDARLTAPIGIAEVLYALQHLHNGRAPGLSGLPAELLRYARPPPLDGAPQPPDPLLPLLARILTTAFQAGYLPQQVKCSLITPVYKRGDTLEPDNYRPIAVTEAITRLYAAILNRRILLWTEQRNLRAECQAGFRPRLSTVHQLFALQHFVDKHFGSGQPLYTCFIDLKGAYDKVQRPLLWLVLQRLGMPEQMIQAIKSLYEGCSVTMNIAGWHGQTRASETGVKQGCPLSPTLFGLFIDGLERFLRRACPEAGALTSDGTRVPVLGYADDFVLLASSQEQLQALLHALERFCRAVGMELCVPKTKVLVFQKGARVPCQLTCSTGALEQVDEFKYLGVLFGSDTGLHMAYEHLTRTMWGAWSLLQQRYRNLHCVPSVHLLLRLYQVCVPPAGSYGCEVWGFRRLSGATRKARQGLASGHVQILRQISGIRTDVPTAILFKELQEKPLQDIWLLRSIRFWNNLSGLPPTSLHRKIALDDCRDAIVHNTKNWAWSLHKALQKLGYSLDIACNTMDLISLAQVRQQLQGRLDAHWDGLALCPRTCATQGARLCTYEAWFAATHPRRHCLGISVSATTLRLFLRFRTGCHGLPVDQGRRGNRVPRLERYCNLCNSQAIGDERHIVFECPALRDLRARHACLFRPDITTMRQFMWQDDLVQVAHFIKHSLARVYDGLETVNI